LFDKNASPFKIPGTDECLEARRGFLQVSRSSLLFCIGQQCLAYAEVDVNEHLALQSVQIREICGSIFFLANTLFAPFALFASLR
jgi:hypothetical protein